jgi:hypothetical protein
MRNQIAVITSNTVPTTGSLKKGELAYGAIGGKLRFFGNTGSQVIELTAREYAALSEGGISVDTNGRIGIAAGGVTELMLAASLAAKINNVIAKDNTVAFVPSGAYNPATKKYVDDASAALMDAVNGRSMAYVFDTKEELDNWIDGSYSRPDGVSKEHLKVGDILLIRDVSVPDYWWDGNCALELEGSLDLSNYLTDEETSELVDGKIAEARPVCLSVTLFAENWEPADLSAGIIGENGPIYQNPNGNLNAAGGDKWRYLVLNAAIGADSVVLIRPDRSSREAAQEAQINEAADVAEGSITVYADNRPATDIVVTIIII